ncbi:hypothetical protein [Candidatus Foliamicus sp.]
MTHRVSPFIVFLLGAFACLGGPLWAQKVPAHSHAQSIFGADPNLSGGAMALRLGDYEQGIRLTLAGLRSPSAKAHSTKTRSAAHSNLCAGYLMAAQFQTALESCNEALRLKSNNWQAHSNRAVLFIMTGQLKRAAEDIERGKRIKPDSRRLMEVEELLAARVEARAKQENSG